MEDNLVNICNSLVYGLFQESDSLTQKHQARHTLCGQEKQKTA